MPPRCWPPARRAAHEAGRAQEEKPHCTEQSVQWGNERRFCAPRGSPMNEMARVLNIGGHVPLVDGPEKVSGRAKYTADLIQPQTLAGRIYRSPCAHAEIIEVDTSEAEKVP